ncbi:MULTISPECIES: hypothetical protein [unclassified Halorubrum]|uniref:hypothetical protein n=1 Tax=unclassified Halorubrum TaxID=2642239 RepID=UPI000B992652|nr:MULTISPECIES: hypothetical protein [unclassified Halorubrum]OYR43489.1 hypothetical protein DJ75_11785 [Halorubrum sp. Eb13]OYR46689.1 hypothetical protein DJ81_02515 [Halorubrum sp. Hd13]OYR52673.1 hypothetical protein DJ74_00870 [Halorubrum sp. Ea8]OYR53304.1 hypothetical protein DJ73_08020 [Halorubrum sp. Ea1]
MTAPSTLSRRRFVTAHAAGVSLTALAGCADDAGPEPADGTDSDAGSGSTDADLDLREANVVDVAVEPVDAGYAFDVTLHHDDEGEDGYANWWQVERLDGSRLGRRELLHAHSEQPFTRSETIAVPDGATCVVVRGHDETHGYGGVAAAVDLDAGTVRRVDQGPDPRSFDQSDCP